MDDLQLRRIANNEARFRAINELVTNTLEREMPGNSDRFTVMCECALTDCTEMIDVSVEQYHHARSDARWFIVYPGHVVPEAEMAVEQLRGYWIVQKIGAGAEIAKQRR